MVLAGIKLSQGRQRVRVIYDPARMTKIIHDAVIELWEDCVGEFIKVAVQNIHIDTGMSMASLLPLGREVNWENLITEQLAGKGPQRFKDKIYRGKGRFSGDLAGSNKSESLGDTAGEEAYDLEFGTPSRPEFIFKFKIVVYQYWLHENGFAKKGSGPWGSLNKARAAFVAYWNNNASEYVNKRLKVL